MLGVSCVPPMEMNVGWCKIYTSSMQAASYSNIEDGKHNDNCNKDINANCTGGNII